MIINTFEGVWL